MKAWRIAPRNRQKYGFIFIWLTPIVALYAFLRFIPILYSFVLSLTDWNLIDPVHKFIGIDNFANLLSDPNFQTALSNTTVFAIATTLLSVVLGFFLAALVAQAGIGRRLGTVVEILFFLPVVIPMVPATLAWRWILNYQSGILNSILGTFGITPLAWLTDPHLALLSVIIISVWKQLGYNMIIFLVGIRAIPILYYEAAAVDGAGAWSKFRYITLPLVAPVLLFVTVLTTIGAYNVFTQVYVLASDAQGAPGYLTNVMVYDIVQNGFRFYNLGYASAESFFLFMIIVVFTLLQFRFLNRPTD